MFILYPAIFLQLFIRSKHFLVESLGTFNYRIILSASMNNFNFSFPIYMPLISLSCLLVIGKIRALYSIRVEREGTIVLFLILKKVI